MAQLKNENPNVVSDEGEKAEPEQVEALTSPVANDASLADRVAALEAAVFSGYVPLEA